MDAATFTTTAVGYAVGYDAFVCQFSVCPSIEMMHDTIFPIRYASYPTAVVVNVAASMSSGC